MAQPETLYRRRETNNNLIENKIRPVALGRKNYLLAWLKGVINRLPAWLVNRLHELLPTIHKVSQ